jgi:hypothetical protein
MKRLILLLLVFTGFTVATFADVRLDIGFDIPRGIGSVAENQMSVNQDAVDFFNNYIFPFPEAGIYYQQNLGPTRVGVGARAFTFILETVFWPNAYVEADLWKFTAALQAGGGLFGTFGLYNSFQTGKVFIPDLSLWFRIGEVFRVGGGMVWFVLPDSSSTSFVYYLGAKFALKL